MNERNADRIPQPPPGPAQRSTDMPLSEKSFWSSGKLPAEIDRRWNRAFELYEQGKIEREEGRRISSLRESVELCPHSKTAELLSRELVRHGEVCEALAWAGFAYALNPRNDSAATHLAHLLFQNAQPERAWQMVAETLNRNEDYGPAWQLLESLGAIR